MNTTPRCVLLSAAAVLAWCAVSAGQSGREILDAAGVRGGLVVHIGCGDGSRTAELAAGEGYVVHGLDESDENIAKGSTSNLK